jgi:hypothetical protein
MSVAQAALVARWSRVRRPGSDMAASSSIGSVDDQKLAQLPREQTLRFGTYNLGMATPNWGMNAAGQDL